MEFKETRFKGLVEIFPKIFGDERGYFFESYSEANFSKNGLNLKFVQDNQSFSTKGVLRGLHLQKPPFAQGKLVRVVQGKVLDVVVDVRKNEPTFGQSASFLLDSKIGNMVYVPEGFAHGFVTIEDALFLYKCTNIYNKDSESGIIWNDSKLNIDWQFANPLVSEKDKLLPTFDELIRTLYP
ncbi:MAG: dTDP-4-dehydrorhamnose 3,5-epimerase [Bacteroidota bacterium]|nr:dTDP-4-dehydrorhamnose 3,5-epimerase [Bacteroidota bacterium]